jgi:hypothetical protein
VKKIFAKVVNPIFALNPMFLLIGIWSAVLVLGYFYWQDILNFYRGIFS